MHVNAGGNDGCPRRPAACCGHSAGHGGGGLTLEAGRLDAGGDGDLREEAEGVDGGQGDVEDVVAGGVEGAGEERRGGALAAATVGDEEGGAIALDGAAEAVDGLEQGGVTEQARLGGSLGEGEVLESEVFLQRRGHERGPFSVRIRTRCAWRASR